MNYTTFFNFKNKKNMRKNHIKQKAFTMIEILMITMVVGIWLLSVVIAIANAKKITNNTKQSIIATQLAQEWIEMVYQIRNTNILRHSDYKNYCRLNMDPYEPCTDTIASHRIHNKNNILTWKIIKVTDNLLNINDWIDTQDEIFSLCLTWWQRTSCYWPNNQTEYGRFFRTIEWKWLFLKNSPLTWGESILCKEPSDWIQCGDGSAKEFRFCSRVEYIWTRTWDVEICGVLTNFFD